MVAWQYGRPGGSAADGGTGPDAWTTAARARQGRDGERAAAAALAAALLTDPHAYVFHDLVVPGRPENLDHVVVRGRRVLIVDAKRWQPGVYWTAGGVTRRGLERVPHADRHSLPAAARHLADQLARPDIDISTMLLLVPSRPGRCSTALYRPAGRSTVTTGRTVAWTVRRAVGTRPVDDDGRLLRALYGMVVSKTEIAAHGGR
jgi:hypothetical protein